MKKLLQPKGLRRIVKIVGGLVLVYVLLYTGLSICGRYQPIAVGISHVEKYAWAPYGFYDQDHAWEGSSYAVHHPTEKTGGWYRPIMWTFVPLWILDNQFIHTGPTDPSLELPPIKLNQSFHERKTFRPL